MNISAMVQGLISRYMQEILEIVVVNDNSTDTTAEVVRALQKVYPNLKLIIRKAPCGVGRALRDGFRAVSPEAEYILSMDSDFITNIPDVASLIAKIEEGYDGVIGSRYIQGGRLVNYPVVKKAVNRLFHFAVRVLCGIRCHDLSNNFKLYRKKLFQELPYRSDDFAMNVETGLMPHLFGYRIAEVPVSSTGRTAGMGKSKFRFLRFFGSYLVVLARLAKK